MRQGEDVPVIGLLLPGEEELDTKRCAPDPLLLLKNGVSKPRLIASMFGTKMERNSS